MYITNPINIAGATLTASNYLYTFIYASISSTFLQVSIVQNFSNNAFFTKS